MPEVNITGFSGIAPRRGARLLEPNQAQVAVNCRLTSGYISPLKPPKLITTPGLAGIQTLFRMTDSITDFWLTWDRDVDAAKGPIAGDTTFRTYYTGDGEPRVTDLALVVAGGAPYPKSSFVLGVHPPQTAASLTHAGGTGAEVSRAFVYTFVTPWGEESQPSPPTAIVPGKVDGTWTIGAGPGMDVAPLNSFGVTGASWAAGIATVLIPSTFGLRVGEEVTVSGVNPSGYNGTRLAITAINPGVSISYLLAQNPGAYVSGGTVARNAPHNTTGMMKRIYWTETLVAGTFLRLVKEVTVATTNTTVAGDTLSTADLVTEDWVMPPTDMKGIQFLPNGAAVGFHGNELLFSPSYIPYAYPVAYRHTFDDIVGIGVVGSMVVVVTKGNPQAVNGIDPAFMTPSKIDQPWPGLSKRSIVNMGFGVAYATPAGLALITLGGASLATRDLYTQEEWLLINPASIKAAQYAGRYVASFDFAVNTRQIFIIDKSEFATEVMANSDVATLYGDPVTGKLYVVIDDAIYEWDADPGQRMIADWFSKEFSFPKPLNLGAAVVDCDFTMTQDEIAAAQAARDAVQAANAVLIAALGTKGSINSYSLNARSVNGSLINELPPVDFDSLTFQIYVDGSVKFSKTLTNSKAFALPSGYKADNVACRVLGNITVKQITLGRTMQELAA